MGKSYCNGERWIRETEKISTIENQSMGKIVEKLLRLTYCLGTLSNSKDIRIVTDTTKTIIGFKRSYTQFRQLFSILLLFFNPMRG